MIRSLYAFFASALFLFLIGCGDSGSNSPKDAGDQGNPNKPTPRYRVNWVQVPAKFNPEIKETSFELSGVQRIFVDAFGFDDDIEVVYSNEVPAGTGLLRLYTVWHEVVRWGYIETSLKDSTLQLKNYGEYACSIKIVNNQITELSGGCYVRLQILLPPPSEIEVYNVGQLITKRFIPMSTPEFLEAFDDATWAEDKFKVIDNFLGSYKNKSQKPELLSEDLGVVVGDFLHKEEKFRALRALHPFVVDRENLEEMIKRKFNFFDQDEARQIVGL